MNIIISGRMACILLICMSLFASCYPKHDEGESLKPNNDRPGNEEPSPDHDDPSPDQQNTLYGIWLSESNTNAYKFEANGQFIAYLQILKESEVFDCQIGELKFALEYQGSYQISPQWSSITLNYTQHGEIRLEKFRYTLNGNKLQLISAEGETTVYIKQ